MEGANVMAVDSSQLSLARPWLFTSPLASESAQAQRQHWAWSYASILAPSGVLVEGEVADQVTSTIDPQIMLADIIVQAAIADMVSATVDPTVEGGGGSIVITGDIADCISVAVDPEVILGSILIADIAADQVLSTIGPFVFDGTTFLAELACMSRVVPKPYMSRVVPKPYMSRVVPKHCEEVH